MVVNDLFILSTSLSAIHPVRTPVLIQMRIMRTPRYLTDQLRTPDAKIPPLTPSTESDNCLSLMLKHHSTFDHIYNAVPRSKLSLMSAVYLL